MTPPDHPDDTSPAPDPTDVVRPTDVSSSPADGGPEPAADPFGLTGAVSGVESGGVGGGLDMGALLEQASQMQQQLAEAQEHAAAQVVEGVAGGGVVRIEVTGAGEFRSVTIAKEAVDPDDVEMLQDLVLAALHDANDQVAELHAGGLGGLDLGGVDLGGLGGLLGGA